MSGAANVRQLSFGILGIAFITSVFRWWPHLSNATTVALGYLVVVLLVAATSRLWVAVTTSVVAMICNWTCTFSR